MIPPSDASEQDGESREGLLPELPECVHLLGAGGAGVSGLARLLHARGHRLTGHDREASPFTAKLDELGIPISLGESDVAHMPTPDAAVDAEGAVAQSVAAIIRSAAIGDTDPQLTRARDLGWPTFRYAQMLGRLAPRDQTLAVAGTHGKTTSTWMLYHALRGIADAESDGSAPGTLVGGLDVTLGTNAVPPEGQGRFAIEACEYDRSFLQLSPWGAAITNVEADHLDCYGTLAAVEEAFAQFASRLPREGLLVLGEDVPDLVESASRAEVWRLGRELKVELGPDDRGCQAFRLIGPGWATPEIQLKVPGEFNVKNAALALALAMGSQGACPGGLDLQARAAAASRGLENFQGVERRFEYWGRDLVHDYAHHPTEVEATLRTARRVFPGAPLHVLFQPHQHSRTAHFLDGFVKALNTADRVVVADVYGARAAIDSHTAGAEELVQALKAVDVDAVYGGPPAQAAEVFKTEMTFETAGLVLGAGDIDGIKGDLLG